MNVSSDVPLLIDNETSVVVQSHRSHVKDLVSSSKFPKRSFPIFGSLLLLVSVVIWVTSAQITKTVFSNEDFTKPFLVSYIQISCQSIFLLHPLVTSFKKPSLEEQNPDFISDPTKKGEFGNFLSLFFFKLIIHHLFVSFLVKDPFFKTAFLALKFLVLFFSVTFVS
jgi:hypothetical protein